MPSERERTIPAPREVEFTEERPAKHDGQQKPLGRRHALRALGAAAAAGAAALMVTQPKQASADGTEGPTTFFSGDIGTAAVAATNTAAGTAVRGTASTPGSLHAGVEGVNNGGGPGVWGSSLTGNGVLGSANSSDNSIAGVEGQNSGIGPGVHGNSTGGGPGVHGEAHSVGANSNAGPGVLGVTLNSAHGGVEGVHGGGPGVWGKSTSGQGLLGDGGSGRGAVLIGATAALQLQPALTKGAPKTGAHQRGDMVLDSVGTLFICTSGGAPGGWVEVQTKPA